MKLHRSLIPPPAVWALLVVLAVLPNYKSTSISDFAAHATLKKFSPAERPSHAFELPASGRYGEQLARAAERPLFSETRRVQPPEPAPRKRAEAAQPIDAIVGIKEREIPTAPPQLKYVGFMRTSDEVDILVVASKTGEEKWMSVGDQIMNWEVVSISEAAVLLEHEGIKLIVEFSY